MHVAIISMYEFTQHKYTNEREKERIKFQRRVKAAAKKQNEKYWYSYVLSIHPSICVPLSLYRKQTEKRRDSDVGGCDKDIDNNKYSMLKKTWTQIIQQQKTKTNSNNNKPIPERVAERINETVDVWINVIHIHKHIWTGFVLGSEIHGVHLCECVCIRLCACGFHLEGTPSEMAECVNWNSQIFSLSSCLCSWDVAP